MALMTEERRKEMEEEMSRFELEILAPGGGRGKGSSHAAVASKDKHLSPPPLPPSAVTSRLPEVAVLAKAPPPPPPHSPPVQTILRPPPPPPMISAQPRPSMQFIPHQLHRQPNRPQMRPNFMGMRGPMPGPHQQFHHPNNYGPPMGMGGPHMPQHHMHPGPHPMHGMPMHHPMNMAVSLPMPPGFCAPGHGMGHNMGYDQQYVHEGNNEEQEERATENENSNENPSVVASAPTIYAAPFVKNQADVSAEAPSGNVQEASSVSAPPVAQKPEKATFGKSTVGPVMPTGNEEAVVSKKREKKKKIVRMAGGQAWEDNSLLEWESDDFRIFCGDLGNDVTDEVLIRAFSKYTSFIKAKVVRDKRTNKTKGFGFVSFKDPQDFIKAMREMNGRYVGSRPIKLRKSTWRDRNIDVVKKKQREKEKLGMM